MLKRYRSAAVAMAALVLTTGALFAAGNYSTYPIVGSGPVCQSTVTGAGSLGGATGQGQAGSGSICAQTLPAGPPFLTGFELIPADTGQSGGASPQTVTIPSPMLGNYWGTPRNFLDNGALNITNTNGTSATTCAAAAAVTVTSMAADRWGCQANVTSGAGVATIVTASPAPPAGFTNSMKLVRNSGSLAQPVCVMQEVTTPQSVQLAGQTVTFSFYAAALAGLSADNGNVINAVVFTGTGTDELLKTPTASPAITPAWTGIATALNQTQGITTTFTRYAFQAAIPSAATEIGVAICFTPTTTTSGGATDGFAFTGAQLERAPGATAFEFRSKSDDLNKALAFFYNIAEGALGPVRSQCHFTTANTAMQCPIVFPVTFYLKPTVTYATGFAGFTTTAETTANACTGNTTDATVATAPSTSQVMMQCAIASGTTAAVGLSMTLIDNGGTGSIKAWAGL